MFPIPSWLVDRIDCQQQFGDAKRNVRFDDRLMTVLEQPAADPRDRAVRWRQLVDLIARAGEQAGNPLVERALEVIRSDRDQVNESLRAATARAIAAKPLPLPLIELFASDRLTVSAPLLAAVRLEHRDWRRLSELADEETRNFILSLRPELATSDAHAGEPAPTPVPPSEPPAPVPEELRTDSDRAAQIGDVVARLEKLRRDAQRRPISPGTPPAGQFSPVFRWECGPSGEISWVEGVPRGPLIGRSLARAEEGEGVADEVVRAFAFRAPFRDARLRVVGDGSAAGEWRMSGVPAFHPASGRFEGYRGVALRERGTGAVPATLPASIADPNSLRELVHEIKTPLNAIIGFAEIIDGQYLGPADRSYRDRAAEIVAQARLLLSAIDDLDFAAKLQADQGRSGSGTDLGALVEQIAAATSEGAAPSSPLLQLMVHTKWRRCSLEPALAERLVSRFCRALLAAAADGETVELHLDSQPDRCVLWCSEQRPAAIRGTTDDLSFSLRVVRGLARIAAGDLVSDDGRISLILPQL